jgi:glycosyltransferase 2 family protein
VRRVLRHAAVVTIVAALVWWSGPDVLLDALAALEAGLVLAALGIGVVTTVCSAWRWCLVARGLGMRLPLPRAVADCYQALFLNAVLPAGVLGDVHRAVGHGRRSGDVGRGVRAVVLERLVGLVVLVGVGVAVLLAEPALLGVVGDLVPGSSWWLAAAVLVAVPVLGWAVRARLGAVVADLRAVLRASTWPGVVGLSVLTLAGYLATFVIAARAAGATAPVVELLPLLVLALLVMALPINVGGWGPREAVAAVGFGAAGFGAGQGFAAAVAYGVLSMVACLPGGAVLLLRLADEKLTGRLTGSRRTSGRGSRAPRVPSPRTPATDAPPHLSRCTPAVLDSAGAGGRRPTGPPA